MGKEINLLDRYPKSKRPIDERGRLVTDEQRAIARKFDVEYFDGDRLTGYGGYRYHPRFFTETVRRFRDHYGLAEDAAILDVGCAKGFMLYDFSLLMPKARLRGIDISPYAKAHAKEGMAELIDIGSAEELPYEDDSFDLVISINTVHNLDRDGCARALREIQRVSRAHAFITVDAWRNEEERRRLEKWNLTARTFMHVDDWKAFFAEAGYKGDYWWFIAE